MRCRNVGQILRYHVQNKLLSPEKLCCQRKNCCQAFHQCTKTNCKRKSPGCYKYKQNEKWPIWWFSWSGFFLEFNENLINNRDPHSPIENNETPGTQCPNESRSEEEHRKLLHFQISCYKYYQVMKLKKHKFLTFKAKGIFQCGSYLAQRLRKI